MRKTLLLCIAFGLVSLLVVIASSFTGIFWDNVVQIYRLSNWLYENGLFAFEVPNTFDPGIPLTIPFLHALAWKVFGKSLFVSHLLMWPFVWGLLWQLYCLVSYFVGTTTYRWWVFALVLADPTLLSVITLVNYEVVQYFLFFGAVNAVLRQNNTLKALFLVFLGLISLRSMMLCLSVFLFDLSFRYVAFVGRPQSVRQWLLELVPYVLGAIPAIAFLLWHYLAKGWVFGNDDSPWAECGTLVDFTGFIRNVFVVMHRFLDFGRFFLWLALLYFFVRYWKELKLLQPLTWLFVTSAVVVGAISLFLNNAMGHRYFLASYLVLALLLSVLIIKHSYRPRLFFGVLTVLLLLGNFWIYPRKISQGWDASLAHLPYWHLRHDMIRYMDAQGISVDETASFFPNDCTIGAVDISVDNRKFPSFDGSQSYVFYSNVYNLSDEGYALLDSNYIEVHRVGQWPVHIVLLEKID
jgi:hypothetical protein